MTDRPQPADPPWVPFDRKLPIVGVDPDDLSNQWAVCFNAAWLPYVLGAIAALSRVEIWDTASYTDRNLEAQRGEHLLTLFMENCSMPQTLLRLCQGSSDCGIEVSYDSGVTWDCLNLNGCIADLVTQGVEGFLANGTIAPGGNDSGPTSYPTHPECVTWHVQLPASSVWHLPLQISSGDQITVSSPKGSWSDGLLGVLSGWNCPNGDDFILGACGDPRVPLVGDPNQEANHMELMLDVNDTYLLPLRGVITIPGGIDHLDAVFMANYANMPNGQGTITFDVDYCPAEASWCKRFDFTASDQGWYASSGSGHTYAYYVSGQGWGFGDNGYNIIRLDIDTDVNVYYVDIYRDFTPDSGRDILDFLDADNISTLHRDTPDFTETVDGIHHTRFDLHTTGTDGSSHVAVFGDNTAAAGHVTKIEFRGSGNSPFGASNC